MTTINNLPKGFSYHGRKNQTILPNFITICKMSQKKLKQYLVSAVKDYYTKDKIVVKDGYIFIEGNIPVMLTAHMDTVHEKPIKDYYEWVETQEEKYDVHVLSSPQGIGGDDRCGIWIILQILKETELRPYIIFCEDEEIGCVGASKFCKNTRLLNKCESIKFIVELDRRGKHDLVFYDCDNLDFIQWCEEVTGWKENYGTCSDISYLAPEIGCSAVNLSCGYYDEHRLYHTVIIEEMFNTFSTTIKLIRESETVDRFEYIECKYNYPFSSFSDRRYYDYDYGYTYGSRYGGTYNKEFSVEFLFLVYTEDGDEEEMTVVENGSSIDECFRRFFENHPYACFNDILDYIEYEG